MADYTPRDGLDDLFQPQGFDEEPAASETDHTGWELPLPISSDEETEAGAANREEELMAAFRTLSGRDRESGGSGGSSDDPWKAAGSLSETEGTEEPAAAPSEAAGPDASAREEAVFNAFRNMARPEAPAASEEPAASDEPDLPKVSVESVVLAPELNLDPEETAPEQTMTVRRRKRPTAQQRREMAERTVVQDPVTIGKKLRSNQMLVYDSELDEVDYNDENDLPEMRDYLPIRFRRYGRLGLAGGIMYALFVISISVVLACLAWMFASDVLALNKDITSAIVTIDEYVPEGDDPVYADVDGEQLEILVDIDQVAAELKSNGIIEYEWLFKLYSRFSHAETKIDPGTYDVSTELDYRALVTALQFGSGNQEITRITFPEGLTVDQIFQLLEENHICHVSELYEAAANYDFDYDFLSDTTLGDENRLEGYLFPDTYDFYQGEDASIAINRFLRNTNSKITSDMRSLAANRGLSFRELLTVASLIEKEAGSDEERPIMASVIYNRLNAGMLLQLDSTLNYIKGTSTFDLTEEDMAIDDPYNTYLYYGLPPGPICCPGLASIEAALNPESTDYWYWYSVDGVSTFFTNFDEFSAFAAEHPY